MTDRAARGAWLSAAGVPSSHADLLRRPLLAHVATITEQDTPRVTPMWFSWEGRDIRLSHTTLRRKVAEVRRRPCIGLSIVDPDDPFRYIAIQGVVRRIEDDPRGVFYEHLCRRYGVPVADPTHRVVIVVKPIRSTVQGSRSGSTSAGSGELTT